MRVWIVQKKYAIWSVLLITRFKGLYCANYLYSHYIRPNGLENDVDYLTNDLIPAILDVVGKYGHL